MSSIKCLNRKAFEPSETKMAYELHKTRSDAGIADSRIGLVRRMSNSLKQIRMFLPLEEPDSLTSYSLQKDDEGLRMSDAMNNLRYESYPRFLEALMLVRVCMAKMFTSANLAFILPNFFRDVLTALIHLSEEDNKKVLIKDALNFKTLAGLL